MQLPSRIRPARKMCCKPFSTLRNSSGRKVEGTAATSRCRSWCSRLAEDCFLSVLARMPYGGALQYPWPLSTAATFHLGCPLARVEEGACYWPTAAPRWPACQTARSTWPPARSGASTLYPSHLPTLAVRSWIPAVCRESVGPQCPECAARFAGHLHTAAASGGHTSLACYHPQ